jgi:hypothetical protein
MTEPTFGVALSPAPTPIDAEHSWTAEFESWDQRLDDAYYWVTVWRDGTPVKTFMAKVNGPMWEERWDDPAVAAKLRQSVHEVAVAGEPNTDYLGRRPPQGRQ